MSGVALKITTLLIRTVSKPIANRIKAQAREHEGFRRICVGWAQLIHRVDMRLRLGLLQDPAVLEKQAAREAQEVARKKRLAEAPTVKTEAETKADEEAAKRDAKEGVKKLKEEKKPKIKPLSESKAIDLGSNFIAESFLFMVAVGTVLFETYRSRKKESTRRDDVKAQLEELKELDDAKSRKIEEMEREIRELKSHEWHWPWQKGYSAHEQNDEEKALPSKILAQVAEKDKERKETTEHETAKLAGEQPQPLSESRIPKREKPAQASTKPVDGLDSSPQQPSSQPSSPVSASEPRETSQKPKSGDR